jgi:hypothetical protein
MLFVFFFDFANIYSKSVQIPSNLIPFVCRERKLWKLVSCGNYGNFNQVHRILIRWPQLKVGCASSEIIGLESWWEDLSE